jgi:KDO2-lipid IV(A) lauroyltransferase
MNKIPLKTLVGYRLMYAVCWAVGRLPMWLLYYPFADFIYLIIYKLARYRLSVVRENLANAFPEKSHAERREIERKYYHNLAEYFVDAIAIASATKKERLKRCPWPDENRKKVIEQAAGRNWIAFFAHYGSWELMSTYGLYTDSASMVSAYQPIRNSVLDLYYIKARNIPPRVNSVPIQEILRYYMTHKNGIDGSPLSVTLIADQSPHVDAQSWWIKFLNQPTVFFHGGEKIARKFGIPVFFIHIKKLRRGYWTQDFEMIWDGTSPTSDHEITNKYARLLEAEIRRAPELWLWSHRRWKNKPWGNWARDYNAEHGTNYPE